MGFNMQDSVTFGPEWYAFTAYPGALPKRCVVSRANNPKGSLYWDETLNCGHVIKGMRGKHPVRRCPHCPPPPPPLEGVTVIVDEVVPYEPGHPRKKGWCWVNEARVPSIAPTRYVLVNPTYWEGLKANPPEPALPESPLHERNMECVRLRRAGMSSLDIAKKMGLTRQRILQILKRYSQEEK